MLTIASTIERDVCRTQKHRPEDPEQGDDPEYPFRRDDGAIIISGIWSKGQ